MKATEINHSQEVYCLSVENHTVFFTCRSSMLASILQVLARPRTVFAWNMANATKKKNNLPMIYINPRFLTVYLDKKK